MKGLIFIFWLAVTAWAMAADVPLRVASLNPIASDLARQVGGAEVTIVELMKPGRDPHVYAPTPSDLVAAEGSLLILAMGKGLETYLEKMRATLAPGQIIFEIGQMIPSLVMDEDVELFDCSPSHAHGSVDPHWWHSPRNMKRAAGLLGDAFAQALPSEKAGFLARARGYGKRMDALDQWARHELDRVPASRRRLTTAHAGFNYFCEQYRFKAAPILGLSTLEQPRPGQIRQILDALAVEKTMAIFPEATANPAMLETLAREAGVQIGGVLLTGSPTPEEPTYEAMFRHNVMTIIAALAVEGDTP